VEGHVIIRSKAPLRVSFGGGGGYLLLFCEFDKWHKVAERLEQIGTKVVNFAFEFQGLQTWEISGA
jgi:D-glycero-alpha-D-manno-heptose-7-phosphate kinase